jgi:flagellar hook-associated protein 1 FlgK
MGNLMVSLHNAAGAMGVFEQGMGVVQNNVTNAATAGYARQSVIISANRYNFDTGLTGGVKAGGTLDSRNEYLEASVRKQTSGYGYADEKSQQLSNVETVFSITDGSGISSALSDFFGSFSALTTSPNDSAARGEVISQANALAQSFNAVSNGLDNASTACDNQITAQVDTINATAGKIAALNYQIQQDHSNVKDAGLQSQMHSLLEDLSEVGGFTTLQADDGSVSVYLGGQVPLVMGNKQFTIDNQTVGTTTAILDSQGNDVTSVVTDGRLAASLEVRNTVLPDLHTKLDTLAQSVADSVNGVLATGVDQNGNAPTKNLFTYDATLGAARTMAVTDITAPEIAAASAASPGGNTVALQVAALADAKSVGGYSFNAYYGVLASGVGGLISANSDVLTTATNLKTQAITLRDGAQKVDLNEEAAKLIELQRGYQACAQMVKTLNELTTTVIGLIN